MSMTRLPHDVSMIADVNMPCEFADIISTGTSVSSV